MTRAAQVLRMLSGGSSSMIPILLLALLAGSTPATAQTLHARSLAVRVDGPRFARLAPLDGVRLGRPDIPPGSRMVPSRELRAPVMAEERRRIGRAMRIGLTDGIDLRGGAWWAPTGPRSFLGLAVRL